MIDSTHRHWNECPLWSIRRRSHPNIRISTNRLPWLPRGIVGFARRRRCRTASESTVVRRCLRTYRRTPTELPPAAALLRKHRFCNRKCYIARPPRLTTIVSQLPAILGPMDTHRPLARHRILGAHVPRKARSRPAHPLLSRDACVRLQYPIASPDPAHVDPPRLPQHLCFRKTKKDPSQSRYRPRQRAAPRRRRDEARAWSRFAIQRPDKLSSHSCSLQPNYYYHLTPCRGLHGCRNGLPWRDWPAYCPARPRRHGGKLFSRTHLKHGLGFVRGRGFPCRHLGDTSMHTRRPYQRWPRRSTMGL